MHKNREPSKASVDRADRSAKAQSALKKNAAPAVDGLTWLDHETGLKGEGEAGTFSFLGFTHECGKNSQNHFVVWRRTVSKRMTAKPHAGQNEDRDRRLPTLSDLLFRPQQFRNAPGLRNATAGTMRRVAIGDLGNVP